MSKIINMIGPPLSGKTTLAAKLFASFKETGIPCEFLTEYARSYIIEKKYFKRNKPVILDENDQVDIMEGQITLEGKMYAATGPDVYLICDSSYLNSLFYMTPKTRNEVKNIIDQNMKFSRLYFYNTVVPNSNTYDPNRIHTLEQAKEIEKAAPDILQAHAPGLNMTVLTGDLPVRYSKLLETVLYR